MKKAAVPSILVAVVLLAVAVIAEAQQPKKVPRIGYLSWQSLLPLARPVEAFRQGLRELGYIEGKNIVIEYRYAEGKLDRLPALAAELVRLRVDVIVTSGHGSDPCGQESDQHDSHCHEAAMQILLEMGSSPVSPGRAEMSQDWRVLPRN